MTASLIQPLFPPLSLRNLVKLLVCHTFCRGEEGCSFRLTDDNVKDLAAVLSHPENLRFGNPCRLNTCQTTVASLMSLSRCPGLSFRRLTSTFKRSSAIYKACSVRALDTTTQMAVPEYIRWAYAARIRPSRPSDRRDGIQCYLPTHDIFCGLRLPSA